VESVQAKDAGETAHRVLARQELDGYYSWFVEVVEADATAAREARKEVSVILSPSVVWPAAPCLEENRAPE